MPVHQRLLFAVLTLAAFALLLEGALGLLHAGNPVERLSLTRGFSNSVRYIVPDPAQPGAMRTQMFSGEAPEVEIPPASGRLRVFMMGGSNTEGFDGPLIEKELNAAAPVPGFQVINLGRRGYGSERVRILLRQALELHPDIVLIYVGHNEFVEQGFAAELAESWPQPWVARLVDRLSGSRTMNVAMDVAEALRRTPAGAGDKPEARTPRPDAFRDMTYDRTVLFYNAYRENLRAMCTMAREAGARVLLSTVVSNDFDPPAVTTFPAATPADVRERVRQLRGQALASIPSRFRPGLIQTTSTDPPIHLRPEDWCELAGPEELARRRSRPEIPATPRLRPIGAPVGAEPLWPDPHDWSDRVPVVLGTFAQIMDRRLTDDERLSLDAASSRFNDVLALCPDHPTTLFELGICRFLLGDDTGASRLLRAAASYDRAPTRGNDVTNGVVRDLARDLARDDGSRFVDSDAYFRGLCPQGLIGYEVMMDNCHLHARVRQILVENFVPALLELGRQAAAGR